MNNTEKNNFITSILIFSKKNTKYIIILIIILMLIFSSFYLYNFFVEKKMYETSIKYNKSKNLNSENDFLIAMSEISENKNFFGILASLEIINNNVKNKNYNEAYNNYLKILESKNLDKNYRSLISIHASYNLIDKIEISKIYNILDHYDDSAESFLGFYNEILFLLSIIEKDKNKIDILYNKIISNNKISETIKQRVKNINDFENNK
tara:strand:+ start:1080 stop:1703 length:624 start_codon:yes stop_codon:yes gene_type:complete